MNKKVFDRYGTVWACVFLVVATLAVFSQVHKHEFLDFDDSEYVTENEHVQSGLTRDSIIWAFTTGHASNWHPLTWLSLMLDYQLFGLRAGAFHITNLLLHTANTLLLFLVLRKMTRSLYRSGFVALVFALHPLHVESVAWVAERKDVLSTLFWLLTMWVYSSYAQRGGGVRYLIILLLFGLGLMAKPMLVTLPCVLLLVDYWPLRRLESSGRDGEGVKKQRTRLTVARLVLEKIPLFVLSVISSIITVIVQRGGGAVISAGALPIGWRVSNAIVCYVVYILKMIVPVRLAAFYPNMSPPALIETIGAAVALVCITIVVVRGARRWRYLATGWLWYIGTLVPVIGVVQVGAQAYADRYAYVPLIGLFIIVGWLVPDILAGWRYKKIAIWLCTFLAVVPMAIAATLQVGHWRNTVALFEHTLAVTEDNCVAHNGLANKYGKLGQIDKSIEHGREAVRICPQYRMAHYNLGMGYYHKGELEKAIERWQEALRLKQDYREVNFNIGVAFEALGEADKAVEYFRSELAINPGHKRAQQKLDALLTRHPH